MAIKKSETLLKDLSNLFEEAKKSIIDLMQENGVTEINMLTDKEGRNVDDDDCDEDFIYDYRVWAFGQANYCYHEGYITLVKIKDGNIILEAEDEESYDDEQISHTTRLYISILENLEMRFNN